MERTVYDLTGLSGFDVVLEPLQRIYPFSVNSAEHLAKQDLGSLTGQIVLLSDERFDKETDEDIVRYLERLTQTGLKLLYVGVPRNTSYFGEKLHELGVNAHLVAELTEEGVQHWLATVLEPWVRATEVENGSLVLPLPISGERVKQPILQQDLATSTSSLCIVVSGAPGAGTTFIGLNLATWLAERGDVQYVEAGLRPCLTTWLGAEEQEATATLTDPLHPAVEVGQLAVYTRNPFGDEPVPLRKLAEAIQAWPHPTVLDVALQDYLASMDHAFAPRTLRVLVTTSDLHRCRTLEGIAADVVVVNQVPTRLPVDETEFQAFWPQAHLVFVPYEPQQGVAIVQGQAVLPMSETVSEAIARLWHHIERGENHETHLV